MPIVLGTTSVLTKCCWNRAMTPLWRAESRSRVASKRACCVECGVVEAIQRAAPAALGDQDVGGFLERVVREEKTVPGNFELRRHYNATLSRWTDFRNGVCPHTG